MVTSAVHTDGRFYWTELTTSLHGSQIYGDYHSPDGFIQWYYAGIFREFEMGIVVAVDGILMGFGQLYCDIRKII